MYAAALFLIGLLTGVVWVGFQVWSRPKLPANAPSRLAGWPILGSLGFFRSRAQFLTSGKLWSSNGIFSFYYGPHRIVALAGEVGTPLFFHSRDLDFATGYSTLFGAGPDVKSMDKFNILQRSTAHSAAGYRKFFTTKNLKERLPKLNQDIAATFDALDLSKASDSFAIFYGLIYQLTQRSLGCNDVADNPDLLAKTLEMFTRLDCTSGVEVMFPSLVTPNKRQKKEAGRELFQIMHTIMENRRQTGERGDDAMQRLMDDGDSDLEITFFIVRALFAGLLNTGVNASWIPVYLAQDTEWRDRVRSEVDAIVAKYRQTADEGVTDVLARVEFEDWEEGFPSIALALKESIRINVPGSAFRKNMSGKDIQIPGTNTVIPKDAFACFLLDDRHMDPDIYADPETWNPRRYLEGRAEDKKSSTAYLGWGTGLHPCLGTRFAKLETHMAVATFVARFNFELCDKDMGPRTSPLPVTDRDWHSAKPIFGDMYLKITKRQ